MYEELQLALMDVVTPERLYVILDAQQLLNQIGLTTADDELQQIFGLQDGISDYDLFISRIDACLIYALGGALREYGITCKDDVSMANMCAILRTVANFEFYVIPETLVNITHDEELTNEEIVAELVSLFTELSLEEALEGIAGVEDSTILRMQAVSTELDVYTVTDTESQIEHRELRLRRINQMLADNQWKSPIITLGLSRNGVKLGQSLELLVSTTYEDLEASQDEHLPTELLALVYFSNTPIEEILSSALDLVDEFFEDNPTRLRVRKEIEDIYNEYSDLNESLI